MFPPSFNWWAPGRAPKTILLVSFVKNLYKRTNVEYIPYPGLILHLMRYSISIGGIDGLGELFLKTSHSLKIKLSEGLLTVVFMRRLKKDV